jgi:hypothetical protein
LEYVITSIRRNGVAIKGNWMCVRCCAWCVWYLDIRPTVLHHFFSDQPECSNTATDITQLLPFTAAPFYFLFDVLPCTIWHYVTLVVDTGDSDLLGYWTMLDW